MGNVYIEARPKGRPDHSPIDDFGLAAKENNPEFRIKCEEQAAAYRKIAANRAEKLGVELPEISN
jgi:hypothetical protein